MESRELRLTEETVEDVTHLMEECDNIIVSHESWFTGSGLGEVGNHGCQGVATRAIGLVIPSEEAPHCRMRVFRLWKKNTGSMEVRDKITCLPYREGRGRDNSNQ